MGTPFQPNFKNSILLLEEVWSEPYKIDSMLSQLELAGVFSQISGLIFGQFERCDAQHFPDRDGTVNDIINEWSNRISVPCIKEFPYGHGDRRCVLPIGKEVVLDAEIGTLTIL
jgi:muramoyltetrapeptide carboxypeptidase